MPPELRVHLVHRPRWRQGAAWLCTGLQRVGICGVDVIDTKREMDEPGARQIFAGLAASFLEELDSMMISDLHELDLADIVVRRQQGDTSRSEQRLIETNARPRSAVRTAT